MVTSFSAVSPFIPLFSLMFLSHYQEYTRQLLIFYLLTVNILFVFFVRKRILVRFSFYSCVLSNNHVARKMGVFR
jgi:hypothetical protein